MQCALLSRNLLGVSDTSSFYTSSPHIAHCLMIDDDLFYICRKLFSTIVDKKLWPISTLGLPCLVAHLLYIDITQSLLAMIVHVSVLIPSSRQRPTRTRHLKSRTRTCTSLILHRRKRVMCSLPKNHQLTHVIIQAGFGLTQEKFGVSSSGGIKRHQALGIC